ncbi:MAG: hypothetical protein SH818_00770 [Saprospiraceae bacterium]|nr:hypothetical protein [Saprospiraceae bacterium]
MDIYNISAQSWSTSELGLGRYGISAVATGNKVFFAGGQNGDGL